MEKEEIFLITQLYETAALMMIQHVYIRNEHQMQARRQQKRIFQGICPGWHFVFSESFRGMSAAGVVDEWIVLDAIGT